MSSSWYGWPSSFYLYGCLGIVWTILWVIFGSSSPADHKHITNCEKDYIETSLGTLDEEEEVKIKF